MSALDRISGVSRLLDEWKEVERLHQSPVNVLERYVLKLWFLVVFVNVCVGYEFALWYSTINLSSKTVRYSIYSFTCGVSIP